MVIYQFSEFDKLIYRKLFRAQSKDILFEDGVTFSYQLLKRIAHLFSPLVKSSLDNRLKELLIAIEPSSFVPCHTNNGRFDFRRRVKDIFINREQIFYVIKRLQ